MLLGGNGEVTKVICSTCFDFPQPSEAGKRYLFPFSDKKWDTEVLSIISRTEFETQGPHNRAGLSWPQVAPGPVKPSGPLSSEHPPHLAVQLTVLSWAWARAKSSTAGHPTITSQCGLYDAGRWVKVGVMGKVSVLNERKEVLVEVMVKISITDTRSIWGTASTASWIGSFTQSGA